MNFKDPSTGLSKVTPYFDILIRKPNLALVVITGELCGSSMETDVIKLVLRENLHQKTRFQSD